MRLAEKSIADLRTYAPSPRRGGLGWGLAYFLLIIVLCARALASPTSLNIIPTADVLPHGVADFDAQLYGGPTSSGYLFVNQFQTELGIGDNIEFGYDVSLGPGGPSFWNAKYRAFKESNRRPAVAVGVLTNVGWLKRPLYVTSYKTFGQTRLHAGAIQMSTSIRAMLGWDLWYGQPFTLQADYVSGSKSYVSFGAVYTWSNGLSLNVAQLIGNSSSAPNAYLVSFSWTGPVL